MASAEAATTCSHATQPSAASCAAQAASASAPPAVMANQSVVAPGP